ncbi:hypothetical protein LCGC14_2973350, partial [marine sediment metagenome]
NGPMSKQVTTIALKERFDFVPTGSAAVKQESFGSQTGPFIVVESSEAVRQGGMYRCSGAADDVIMQEAVDLAEARGAGTRVELTEGKFNTTAAVNLKNNVDIIGRGRNTIVDINGDDYAFSLASDVSNCLLSRIRMQRTGSDEKALVWFDGSDWIIKGCYFHTFRKAAIEIKSSAQSGQILNNIIDNIGVTATAVLYGVLLWAGKILVNGNTIRNFVSTNAVSGISLTTGAPECIISENTIHDLAGQTDALRCSGIFLSKDNAQCLNNKIYNIFDFVGDHAAAGFSQGIGVSGDKNVISGNKISNCFWRTIEILSGATNNMVTNNFCYDNGQLIDRGGCESTTSPMIFGETVSWLNNVDTYARSNEQAYEG